MIINTIGLFTLLAPFNSLVPGTLQGTVVGINSITQLVANGEDVKSSVYTPQSADVLYQTHLDTGVNLVYIKSATGVIYRVPESHISKVVDDTVIYNGAYITINVGDLPANYDYTTIKQTLSANVSDVSGVSVAVEDIFISIDPKEVILTKANAVIAEDAREAAIKRRVSDYGLLQAEKAKNAILLAKLHSAEERLLRIT